MGQPVTGLEQLVVGKLDHILQEIESLGFVKFALGSDDVVKRTHDSGVGFFPFNQRAFYYLGLLLVGAAVEMVYIVGVVPFVSFLKHASVKKLVEPEFLIVVEVEIYVLRYVPDNAFRR